MSATDFPTLSMKIDGTTYKTQLANPAIEPQDTDGGYEITRPKYTRTPPRTFTFQFTDISAADRTLLENHWDLVKGSSLGFNWTEPTTAKLYNVRYSKGFELQFSRTGYGSNHRYDTNTISFTEV